MVKRKSLPKPADRAGFAAQTADRVSDSTSDTASSSSKEQMSTRTSPRKSLTTLKQSKANVTKTKSKKLTPVLKEIRELQKSTNLLIPRAPFLRLLRELLHQRSVNEMRITEMAVEALREASENVLVSVFEDSYLLALHAKRVTLMPRDVSLLLRIRNDFNLLNSS